MAIRLGQRACSEVDAIVWTKIRRSLDGVAGGTKTVAVRLPSIPGLNRRSGRIPAHLSSYQSYRFVRQVWFPAIARRLLLPMKGVAGLSAIHWQIIPAAVCQKAGL